jgi:hypothetical protein
LQLPAEKPEQSNFLQDDSLGNVFGSFVYAFRSDKADIISLILSQIEASIQHEFPETQRKVLTLIDNDRRLTNPEKREFFILTLPETSRSTTISVVFYAEARQYSHVLRWWVLLQGPITSSDLVGYVLFSPFTLPFWFWSRIQGRHNVVAGLRSTYGAFFDYVDIYTADRVVQKMALDDLIAVLDANGVDTSDLKLQRNQTLNINVSGGQASFGSVVQGKMDTGRS